MAETPEHRAVAVGRLVRLLRRVSSPRLLVTGLLVLTCSVGFLASFGLLSQGLTVMWIRYPLSALAGYFAFLIALKWWAGYFVQQPGLEVTLNSLEPAPDSVQSRPDSPVFPDADIGLVLDDLPGLVIAVVVLLIATVVGLWSIVWSAPTLLAEVLLDALLVAGLWRRYKRRMESSTIDAAFRFTWAPALGVIVCLAGIGYCLQLIEPTAVSIGDLFR